MPLCAECQEIDVSDGVLYCGRCLRRVTSRAYTRAEARTREGNHSEFTRYYNEERALLRLRPVPEETDGAA